MELDIRPTAAAGLALVAAALAFGSSGCGDAPAVSARSKPPTAVSVEAIVPRELTPTLTVPGLVEARSRIELAFRVDGFVERFHVDEGDRVEAGDVLAELDAGDLAREVRAARAAVARAQAQADDAEHALRRQDALLARSSTSQRAYDRARSAAAVARAELAAARVRLEGASDRHAKAVLRAPIAGVIERRLIETHERATAQSPVLVLVELDTVEVRAAVADSHLARLRPGGRARVRTPLWPGRSFEGRISRIDVAADRVTRTVPFEIELDNPDGALRPELAVEVEVPLGEPRPRVLVPTSAVLRDTDATPFCFVVVGDGDGAHVERRPLALGGLHGEHVVVESGIAAGDRLVTRGQHFVREDDAVRVVAEVPPIAPTGQTP